jgi:LPXTG-motif cell wall-anchored protein
VKNKILIGAIVAGSSLMIGGLAAEAQQYPPQPAPTPPTTTLPLPTTTIAQASPEPPPVTLPPTGSNGVDETVIIGATIALAGGALILVSRRRRDSATTE